MNSAFIWIHCIVSWSFVTFLNALYHHDSFVSLNFFWTYYMFCRLRPFYKLFVVQIVFPRNREKMLLSFISSYYMQLWILFRTLHGLLVPCEFCSSRYNHKKERRSYVPWDNLYVNVFPSNTCALLQYSHVVLIFIIIVPPNNLLPYILDTGSWKQ